MGMTTKRCVGRLFWIRLKIRFREWPMIVLLIAMPLLMVGITGALSSDDLTSGIEALLPGGIVFVFVIAGVMFQSFSIASDKGKGILRRVGTVPTPRAAYLLVESFVTLALIGLVIAILFAFVLPLGVEIRGSLLSLVAVILLGAFTLMALSAGARSILRYIPSTSSVEIFQGLISGSGTLASNLDQIGIITIWLVVCWIITALTFRWE
jgi:ABC-type transport system involved in cytochrome c biogenesis permease component